MMYWRDGHYIILVVLWRISLYIMRDNNSLEFPENTVGNLLPTGIYRDTIMITLLVHVYIPNPPSTRTTVVRLRTIAFKLS